MPEPTSLPYEGEISGGSLLAEDVVPKLLDYLEAQDREAGREMRDEWDSLDKEDTEAVTEFWSEVMDEIDSFLPDGYSCRTAEGDGASFGVWPVEDEVDMLDSALGEDDEADPGEDDLSDYDEFPGSYSDDED